MSTNDAYYRKHNDRTHNSSTYHKKDGTPVRARLKREAQQEVEEELAPLDTLCQVDDWWMEETSYREDWEDFQMQWSEYNYDDYDFDYWNW